MKIYGSLHPFKIKKPFVRQKLQTQGAHQESVINFFLIFSLGFCMEIGSRIKPFCENFDHVKNQF